MLLLSDTATLLVKGHSLLAQFYNNYPTTTQQKFLLMLLLYINTSIIIFEIIIHDMNMQQDERN